MQISPELVRNISDVLQKTDFGVPTFPLHADDPIRAEPLAADLLLQVKRPPPVNLLIRDAVVMVTSTGTGPLHVRRRKERDEW